MRKIKIYWRLFRLVGNAMRSGRQTDQIFRYFVLKALDGIGFFEYLREPRSFGEIMSRFQFEDTDYAHEMLEIMELDKQSLLVRNSDLYTYNDKVPMPDFDEIVGKSHPGVRQMSTLAEAMQDSILERLKKEKLGVKEVFERNQKKVVNTFNELLGGSTYSTVRELSFQYLFPQERMWLRGKDLLEIGCGSGLETAELWLMLDGEIRITAIDTVPSMLELAEAQFEQLLQTLEPDHPDVSDENRPVFKQANAVSLPYPDESFDAVFGAMMLHWTSDPSQAIREAVRVLKPGGLIFGAQPGKPQVNPYSNFVIRSSRDSYGFFWKEDLVHWMSESGIELDNLPPINIFRGRKPIRGLIEKD